MITRGNIVLETILELESKVIKDILEDRKDVSIEFIYGKKSIDIILSSFKVSNEDLCREVDRLSTVAKVFNKNRSNKLMTVLKAEDNTKVIISLQDISAVQDDIRISVLETLIDELGNVKYEDTNVLKFVSILMKPTHRCNMDCSYCYDKPYRDAIKVDMDIELLEETMTKLSKGVEKMNIIWHGGEMTLLGTQWFRDAHDMIDRKFPNLVNTYSCMSNGLLLNEEWFKTFKDLNIEPGVSYNYKAQKDLRSDIDIENLLMLSRKHGVSFGVIDVITCKNIDQTIEAYDYYNEKKLPACFNRVFVTPQVEKNSLLLEEDGFSESFSEYFDHVLMHRNPVINERSINESIKFFIDPRDNTCTYNDCRNKWLGVNPVGDIYPCDRYFPEMYKAGNIKDFKNLEDVFYSEGYLKYVEDIEHRLSKYCKKCDYYIMCMGGCNANNITATGSCRELDINYCIITKKLVDISYLKFREIDITNPSTNKGIINTIINKNSFTVNEITNAFIEINPNIKDFIKFTEEDRLNPIKSNEFKLVSSINYLDESTKKQNFNINYNSKILNDSEEVENLMRLRGNKLKEFIRKVVLK